jgi:hypothetical protein
MRHPYDDPLERRELPGMYEIGPRPPWYRPRIATAGIAAFILLGMAVIGVAIWLGLTLR